MARIFNIGYYINEKHISKAVELLNYQLAQKSPLYNITDFTIYKNEQNVIIPCEFYENYVKRDSFYYFENKFKLIKYFGVQRAYKIREFHFFTWDLLVLYYSFGFYIRELLDKYITTVNNIYSEKSINIFYGGSINYEYPNKSKIFYYDDYKVFLNLKETLTKPEPGKIKYAISLDIKSFFYSIDHKILLDILDRKSYATTKKALHYNEFAKETFEFFLKFLISDSKGIPVSGQNIISSFISSIYFSDFDEFVVDTFLDNDRYSYIRYVDDFYIVFSEDDTKPISEIRKEIYSIENSISDFLTKHLNLSVSSSKSDRFVISDVDSHLDFLNSTGFESPFEQEFDYEELYNESILSLQIKDKQAPEIFDECINLLKKLKSQTGNLEQINIEAKESSYLNFILIHNSCLQYSKSNEAKLKIINSGIFENFEHLDFLLTKIKVILHLVTINNELRNNLFNSIILSLAEDENITQKITILDKFIHQIQFLITELKGLEKIQLQNEYLNYIEIIKLNLKSNLEKSNNDYFSIIYKSLDKDYKLNKFEPIYSTNFLSQTNCIPLVQQIKQRVINEKIGFYNVCFNHLLNEFQNIFEMMFLDGKQKKALEITSEMSKNKFKVNDIKFISEFFDRRNQNSISHTNEQEIGFWGVGHNEYKKYKLKLEELIKEILIKTNA
ncbi:hypothetical protein [Flavobacterium sp.]|uniref:hypothetical protein n=1 Tax=Flavobacterium sp. TaxID=239 RepID=UPI003751B098